MKIGIYTFCNVPNYGAALQAYALKKVLDKMGFNTHIINYKGCGNVGFDPSEKELNIKKNAKKLYWLLYAFFSKNKYRKKYQRFLDFQKEYFEIIPYSEEVNCDFDFIFYGSDQIWNPNITNGFDPVFFAQGAKNAIAYAASAGDVSNITDVSKDRFMSLINNFSSISVREQELKDYLNKSGISDCSLVLDPTLLLDKEDYLALINHHKKYVKKPYVCVYLLSPNHAAHAVAKKISKDKGLDIVEICGSDCIYPNHKVCDAGPIQFLELMNEADYIVTNSYHGTVFSIIFEKNFNVVYSKTGNSRIETLLNYFGLQNNAIINGAEESFSNIIDYKLISMKRRELREESLRYIQDALNIYK